MLCFTTDNFSLTSSFLSSYLISHSQSHAVTLHFLTQHISLHNFTQLCLSSPLSIISCLHPPSIQLRWSIRLSTAWQSPGPIRWAGLASAGELRTHGSINGLPGCLASIALTDRRWLPSWDEWRPLLAAVQLAGSTAADWAAGTRNGAARRQRNALCAHDDERLIFLREAY